MKTNKKNWFKLHVDKNLKCYYTFTEENITSRRSDNDYFRSCVKYEDISRIMENEKLLAISIELNTRVILLYKDKLSEENLIILKDRLNKLNLKKW